MSIKLTKPAPPTGASPKASGGRFEVYSDIPIPKKGETYNFADIALSQMMFVPIEGEDVNDPAKKQQRVSAAASNWGRRHGRKFVTQVITVKGELGVGVWRVQ